MRAEMNISPAKKLVAIPINGNPEDMHRLEKNSYIIYKLANLESIHFASHSGDLIRGVSTFANELEIVIPLANHININEELGRLEHEIAKMEMGCRKLQDKLNNQTFRQKAPANVVAKEEAKLSDHLSILNKLTKRQQIVKNLT